MIFNQYEHRGFLQTELSCNFTKYTQDIRHNEHRRNFHPYKK